MAYTRSAATQTELSYPEASTAKLAKRGLLRRLFDAMIAARQRQADREIAYYLQSIGEKFTDGAEREIARRFLSTPSSW
jgi:hypothetical protein